MHQELTTVVATLEKARAANQAQRQALDTELRRIEQALAALTGEPTIRTEYERLGIVEAAGRWLREVGTPQSTKEIADALLARGLVTKSKKFVPTVYATLRNSEAFTRTDDVWALTLPEDERSTDKSR